MILWNVSSGTGITWICAPDVSAVRKKVNTSDGQRMTRWPRSDSRGWGRGEGRHMCAGGRGGSRAALSPPGAPRTGARGAREHWARLFRSRPSPEWPPWDGSGLCEFPSGTALWAFGSKLKQQRWEEGGKERRGFKMLSALKINGNVCLKHSLFRAGRSSGLLSSASTHWMALPLGPRCKLLKHSVLGDWVITLLIKCCLFLMLRWFHGLSQAGQVGWFPNPKHV